MCVAHGFVVVVARQKLNTCLPESGDAIVLVLWEELRFCTQWCSMYSE